MLLPEMEHSFFSFTSWTRNIVFCFGGFAQAIFPARGMQSLLLTEMQSETAERKANVGELGSPLALGDVEILTQKAANIFTLAGSLCNSLRLLFGFRS